MFNQIEVLAVDRGLTMGDMKGTLLAFACAYFGEDRQIRLRPSYFPFVEPPRSTPCFICGGTGAGCRTCRGEGWIEPLGAGMVHPNVPGPAATTPTRSPASPPGPASSRLFMLRSGLADLRTLTDNDVRWLYVSAG